MKRVPDKTEIIRWNRMDVTVNIFLSPAAINPEGYDVGVEVELKDNDCIFEGMSGVNSVWAATEDDLDQVIHCDVIPQAFADLRSCIIACSEGLEVKRMQNKLFEEEKRMRIAEHLNRNIILGLDIIA